MASHHICGPSALLCISAVVPLEACLTKTWRSNSISCRQGATAQILTSFVCERDLERPRIDRPSLEPVRAVAGVRQLECLVFSRLVPPVHRRAGCKDAGYAEGSAIADPGARTAGVRFDSTRARGIRWSAGCSDYAKSFSRRTKDGNRMICANRCGN
jgi:hypothetical protein